MQHIVELRELAHWAYHSNGVVTAAIDYMKSMHTLDTIIACKSKKSDGSYPKSYRSSKLKMESTLQTIRYKEIIRDAIFRNANDGMYVSYFETVSASPDKRDSFTDYEVERITEINALGVNAMIIPLPIDYVRIVGRKNSSYQIAFDLRYFQYLNEDERKRKLK